MGRYDDLDRSVAFLEEGYPVSEREGTRVGGGASLHHSPTGIQWGGGQLYGPIHTAPAGAYIPDD